MSDTTKMPAVGTIGGFPIVGAYCAGCGRPLLIENAWMTDGCPCNRPLGINSMNETRWRLLMRLQQRQARENEALFKFKAYVHRRLDEAGVPADPESPHKAEGCRIGGRLDIVLANFNAHADLMAACEMVREQILGHMAGAWPGTMSITAGRVAEALKAAIAKAEGKQP